MDTSDSISQCDIKAKQIQRGARSFKRSVRLPREGKPCRLKRHFEGCLRQVVGYIEFLAARDREGFVFVKVETLPRKLTPQYSLRHVKRSLALLEASAIIKRERRSRNRIWFNGWLVVEHDAICKTLGNRCEWSPLWSLKNAPEVTQNRSKGHPRGHPSGHPEGPSEVTFLATDDVTLDDPQLEEYEDGYFDDTEELTRLFASELPSQSLSEPLEPDPASKEEPREHAAKNNSQRASTAFVDAPKGWYPAIKRLRATRSDEEVKQGDDF